jgi:hypothetical protein
VSVNAGGDVRSARHRDMSVRTRVAADMEIVTSVPSAVPILFGVLGLLLAFGFLVAWAKGKGRGDHD